MSNLKEKTRDNDVFCPAVVHVRLKYAAKCEKTIDIVLGICFHYKTDMHLYRVQTGMAVRSVSCRDATRKGICNEYETNTAGRYVAHVLVRYRQGNG